MILVDMEEEVGVEQVPQAIGELVMIQEALLMIQDQVILEEDVIVVVGIVVGDVIKTFICRNQEN